MQQRHKHEEHENDERWLITYADLITLLMVFFVVMWSISRADAAKFASVAKSLNVAFGTPKGSVVPMPATGTSRSSKDAPKNAAAAAPADDRRGGSTGEKTQLQKVAEEIQEMIRERGLQDLIALDGSADGRKLTIRLRDSVLFDRGGAVLTPQAQDLILRLGSVLRDIGMRVSVSGHTDDIPIRSGAYASNWQLSTARSTAVIEYLIEHMAFPPQLLSASGYGEYHPIVPNDSVENRAKNRRVEFVITDEGAIDIGGPQPAPAQTAEENTPPAEETFAAAPAPPVIH